MNRIGMVYDRIVSPDNIRTAVLNAAEGHHDRPLVQHFLDDMDGTVEAVRKMLVSGEFRTGNYRRRRIWEPKQRDIYILPFYPDRIVQHAIVDVLAPLWDRKFIFDSYACRKGKGTTKGLLRTAKFVRRNRYDFKYDIRGFYKNIDHATMKRILAETVKDKRVLLMLNEIVDSFPGDRNCPIGNLTSQWFGNLYLNELDHYVKETLRIRDYIRYCDDFHVFGNDLGQMHAWDEAISDFVRNRLKLEFSKHNLGRTKDGCDFLGYRTFPDKILIRKSTAKRIRRRVAGIRRVLARSDSLGERRLLSILGSIASAKGVAKHAQTHNFVESIGLKEVYSDVFRRYQSVRGHGNPGNRGRGEGEDARGPEPGDRDSPA